MATATRSSVEFFPPYPNDIGFRSSFGSVSGTILYEDGVTPSGDVRVELQPQGQNDARKSIQARGRPLHRIRPG